MIDRTHAPPVSQQTRLVGIARSSAYYRPQPVSETDLLLMRRIDELHMEFPFAGARMLARLLRREGHEVGRRRVADLDAAIQSGEVDDVTAAHARLSELPLAIYMDRARQQEQGEEKVHRQERKRRTDVASKGGDGRAASFAKKKEKVLAALRNWRDEDPGRRKYKSQNQFNEAMSRKHRIGKTTVNDWSREETEKNLADAHSIRKRPARACA